MEELRRIHSIIQGTLETPQNLVPAIESLIALSPQTYSEYAKARANYEHTKSRKDYEVAKLVRQSNASSMSAKKEDAFGSEGYKQYLDELKVAQEEYFQAKANLSTLETILAGVQSINKFVVADYKSNPLL